MCSDVSNGPACEVNITSLNDNNLLEEMKCNEINSLGDASHNSKRISRPFQCSQCGFAFKRKDHLERHKIIHTRVQNLECKLCNTYFKRRSGLSTHMSKRHGVYHNCELCTILNQQLFEHLKTHAKSG